MDYPRLVNYFNLDRVDQEARFSYAETVEYRDLIWNGKEGDKKKKEGREREEDE